MLSLIRSYISSQQYHPGFGGLFVNPFYFARRGLYEHISELAPKISGKILDVGCGQKPYQQLFNATSYTGLEIDTPDNRKNKKADFFYDGTLFPFADGEFDGVIMNEVFEHVFTPDSFLSEVNRVLKVEGTLFMTLPFVWDEHEQPFDFARYSSFGIRSLLERHEFTIIEQRKSMPDIRVIFQLINAYIFKVTVSQNKYLNMLLTLILMAPFNIIGEILAKVLPKNEDLYLDNIILAKKVAID